MDFVKVAKLGTAVKEVAIDSGSVVEDALRAAEVTAEGFEIRINGNPVNLDSSIKTGDILTLVPQIKGGSL